MADMPYLLVILDQNVVKDVDTLFVGEVVLDVGQQLVLAYAAFIHSPLEQIIMDHLLLARYME
jgi:hypothetical protein